MKVYLNGILLPVPPEEIKKSVKNQNKTVTLVNGQQAAIIKPAGLTEITLSKCLLPNTAYDFMERIDGSCMSAAWYMRQLSSIKSSGEAVTLDINESNDGMGTDGGALTSCLVTLEDYTVSQKNGEDNGVIVDIKLRQYVEHGLYTVPVTEDKADTPAASKTRASKSTSDTTYTVQEGDTLWSIAKMFYGDGSKYTYLAELNGISNPNLIRVGQVLKIGSSAKASSASAKKQGGSSTIQNQIVNSLSAAASDKPAFQETYLTPVEPSGSQSLLRTSIERQNATDAPKEWSSYIRNYQTYWEKKATTNLRAPTKYLSNDVSGGGRSR